MYGFLNAYQNGVILKGLVALWLGKGEDLNVLTDLRRGVKRIIP